MISNTWAVTRMDAKPELDGKTDVVFTVHWVLTGTDGTYTGSVYGSTNVAVDPDAPFTPYAGLTQDQVIGWVKSAMGDEQAAFYGGSVAKQIADLINPPVVTPPLPWG